MKYLQFILQLFSIGVLISASVAVSAINQVEDFLNSIDSEYEDAESYRRAAGWLIFVAAGAILCHIVMITVCILYITSVIEKHLKLYGLIVSAHEYTHTKQNIIPLHSCIKYYDICNSYMYFAIIYLIII